MRLPRIHLRFRKISDDLYAVQEGQQAEKFFFSAYRSPRYAFRGGFAEAGMLLARNYRVNKIPIEHSDIVIDVGANVGEFSEWASSQGAKVHAFEIDPMALGCLRRNMMDRAGVTIWEKAASNRSGESRFFLKSKDASSSLLSECEQQDSECAILVKTVRLDEFMRENGISAVKILKVEAEGAEPEVLDGLGDLLRNISYITVDAGPERFGQRTIEPVKSILETHGFSVQVFGNYVLACNVAARSS